MTELLNQASVLVLNSATYPIGRISPKKALIALNSAAENVKVIDVIYSKKEDGSFDLEAVEAWYPYTFSEWLMVDFREGLDRWIKTTKMAVRCPTVIMTSYSKMPMRKFHPTKSLLYEMQKGICGYSGKKMSMKQMNIEHKQARSKGGKNTFANLMLVDQKINSARGDKPLESLGLKPLFNHNEPRPIPAAYAIKSVIHPDWNCFIPK